MEGKNQLVKTDEVWEPFPLLFSLGQTSKQSLWAYALQVFSVAWRGIVISPITFFLTLMVMVLVLSSMATVGLVMENLNAVLNLKRNDIRLSVYLQPNYSEGEKKEVLDLLSNDSKVAQIEFRSKQEALEEFRDNLGENRFILEGIEDNNPLPDSIEIKFVSDFSVREVFDQYVSRLSELVAVDLVQYNQLLLSRIARLARYFQLFGSILIPILVIIAGFIIWVTITLALHSHRHEIEIMRLVGATTLFVTLPYAVEGLIQGALSALLSVGLVNAVAELILNTIEFDFVSSSSLNAVNLIDGSSALKLVLLSSLVGVVGSSLAVRRFLRNAL